MTTNKLAKRTIEERLSNVQTTLDEYVSYLKSRKFGLLLYKGRDLSREISQIESLLSITKDSRSIDDILVDLVLDRINFLQDRGIGQHEIDALCIYCDDLGYEISNVD